MAVWLEPYLLRAMLLPLAFGWALEDTTLHLLYNKHCNYQYTGPGHKATGGPGGQATTRQLTMRTVADVSAMLLFIHTNRHDGRRRLRIMRRLTYSRLTYLPPCAACR